MSERKSWDVQRKARALPAKASPPATPAPSPRTPRATEPVRDIRVQPSRAQSPRSAAPQITRTNAMRQRPQKPPQGTLTERRRSKRRAARYIVSGILILIIALLGYAAWVPALRITEVDASGPGADAAKQATQEMLSGRYAYVLPRNSVFLLPIEKIRTAILQQVPVASAVSISRTSFTTLEVVTTSRAEAFLWCGASIDIPRSDGCYQADTDGFIFKMAEDATHEEPPVSLEATASSSAAVDVSTGSSTVAQPEGTPRAQENTKGNAHGMVRVFGALTTDIPIGASPIGARVAWPSSIPNSLKFVDAVRELGAPVTSVSVRGDEADLWLGGPSRIIYVLGHEHDAAELAASTLPSLNLANGSIQYVDLRFPGKAYIKRFGE